MIVLLQRVSAWWKLIKTSRNFRSGVRYDEYRRLKTVMAMKLAVRYCNLGGNADNTVPF